MNIFQTIILGMIEGLTEFLPVSSTFHLIFAAKILQVPDSEFIQLFEVFIQSGAILAVLLLYFKTLWYDKQLFKKVLISFLPTAIIGLILHKIIKTVFFETNWLMLAVFFGMAGVFFILEHFISQKKLLLSRSLKQLSYFDAVLIGFIQSLAVIPGVSRAGSVLVGMMMMKYKREESAKYSFLLSIPTIFAASALDAYKMRGVLFNNFDYISTLMIGFVTAFITAFFVVQWLIGFLQKNSLISFAWYRILVSGALLLIVGL